MSSPPVLADEPSASAVSSLEVLPSVWLHGAGLSGSTWHSMTAGLAQATTPDLPGHGTAPAVSPARVERFAEALLPAIPAGALLIGHSLGGMVALELARSAPERIRGLVLVEAVSTVRDTMLGHLAGIIAATLFARLPPVWVGRLSGIGEGPATRRELDRQFAEMSRDRVAAALEASLMYDGRAALSAITVPTLVIVGDKNRATHRGARLISQQIAGAQFRMLKGGHMLHTAAPAELFRTIDAFVADRL